MTMYNEEERTLLEIKEAFTDSDVALDLFVEILEDMDSWNGYLGDDRVFDMYMLNDFYCDKSATDLINDIGEHFDNDDDYFKFTIYGLESVEDKIDDYLDNFLDISTFEDMLSMKEHIYFFERDPQNEEEENLRSLFDKLAAFGEFDEVEA